MSAPPGLAKYLDLHVLSERQLYRLFDWDRSELVERKASLAELLGKAPPAALSQWGRLRSSEVMLEAGKVITTHAENPTDTERFRAVLGLVDELCKSNPEVLRTVVWPAVQALQHARNGAEKETADVLERFLLHLSRTAPAVVVSGLVNVGNPRFRGASKKGRTRWRKARIARSIASASRVFQEVFVVPVGERLSRTGDEDAARTLADISAALEAVVQACRAQRIHKPTAGMSDP